MMHLLFILLLLFAVVPVVGSSVPVQFPVPIGSVSAVPIIVPEVIAD